MKIVHLSRRIVAIDPGTEQSALVFLGEGPAPRGALVGNFALARDLLAKYSWHPEDILAIEMPKARGQRAGDDLFATCRWVGRFQQAWTTHHHESEVFLICRQEVVYHFCAARNVHGADAALRQCLIDRYGPGKAKAIGTKHAPGPLYGMRRDMWQALAIGTYVEEHYVIGTTRHHTPGAPGQSVHDDCVS